MNEYNLNLMEQFAKASGLGCVDYESESFRREFSVWLELNKSNLDKFYRFLQNNEELTSFNNILEVGQGNCDSILINYGKEGTVISPYQGIDFINEYVNVINSKVFTSNEFDVTEVYESNLSNVILNSEKVISCNPLSEKVLLNCAHLNREFGKDVLFGIYGNISDADANNKKTALKNMRNFLSGYSVYNEEVDANTYCAYVTSANVKIR